MSEPLPLPPHPSGFIPSPCVSLCKVNAQGFCAGCKRSLSEIAGWGTMSAAEKLTVWEALLSRKASD